MSGTSTGSLTETLTIVGAGPVGSLLALMLARRGHRIELYERRADMRRSDISAGRSINLAVSVRGLEALLRVGLDQDVLAHAVPMRGRMMHAVSGELTFQRYGTDDTQFINSMSRGGLNKLLMSKAEETGRVRIHFEQRLTDYDFDTRKATFLDERSGTAKIVEAPVILGTDGAGSALRSALVERTHGALRQDVLDSGYKELTLAAVEDGSGRGPDGRFALEPNALHIWPRGRFMLIALPNLDGSFTCTLFLPFRAPAGEPSFEHLPDARSCDRFFAKHFPDALALMPEVGEALHSAPLGQMGTVRLWPWAQDAAMLLGDASHAIVPFFGQGMNAGFEDCSKLAELLDSAHAKQDGAIDWRELFERFATERKPNTDAIAELAIDNFIEMRDRVADPRFLLQKGIEVELQRRFPGRYVSRYALVTFTRVPYRAALELGELQNALLDELSGGVTRIEDVDFGRAEALIDERLVPCLRARGL